KIQALINHKEKQSKDFLNVFICQMEEIGTLQRLRDFAEDEERPQLTSEIKENLTETIEKEVAFIAKNIETKLDKNQNLYFKLTLRGLPNCFYAFSYNFPVKTFRTLQEAPEKLINQLALIAYQELENKDKNGIFYKVKSIEIYE
ncbi:5581_t:CDS:2, partial [Funneliformis geosporum]